MKKLFFVLFLFFSWCMLANALTWDREIAAHTGDIVTITWEYPEGTNIERFDVYQQVGLTGTTKLVSSLDPSLRGIEFIMPSGKTKQFRFRIVAVIGTSSSPAGWEIVVNRI